MPSVGSLTVEIAADIAKLRSGIEETQTRLSGMERSINTHSRNMQSAWDSSLAGIRTSTLAATAVITAALVAVNKAWAYAKAGADYEEQRGILDNLSRKYNTTADGIVNAMKKAADGQIASVDAMAVALKGLGQGLKPDQIIELSNAAKILGDVAGKSVTEALQDLTNALETGRTKGLKNYLGTTIDLKDTFGDLESAMTGAEKAQALYLIAIHEANKLQAQQTKNVSDTADNMERLSAGWKDAKLGVSMLAKDAVDATFKILDTIAAAQDLQNQIYDIKIQAGKRDYGLSNVAEGAIARPETTPSISEAERQYQQQIEALKARIAAHDKSALSRAAKDAAREQKLIEDQLFKSAQEQANAMRQIKEISDEENRKIEERELQRYKGIADEKLQIYQDLIDQITALNGSIASSQTSIDQSIVARSIDNSNITSPLMGLMDSMGGEDPYQQQIDRIEESYALQLELFQDYQGEYIAMADGFYTKQEAMQRLAAQRQQAIDRLSRQQKLSMASDTFGTMAGIAQAFYQASDNQSRLALQAYKAFAIAQATIDMFMAAQSSYAWGAKFGGPVLGAAMAAIAVAAGIARIASIQAVHMGSSSYSGGASVGSGTATTDKSVSESSTSTASAESSERPLQVTIHIYGNVVDQDKFARELVPSIRKAMRDGV